MRSGWIYLCFFLSGFSGLVNEVVWSRLFVFIMGCSHHSIAVVVSVFMGGLALGSFLGGRLADRVRSPLRLYGWVVGGAGLVSGAVVPLLWISEPFLGWVYRLHDGQPGHPLFTLAKALVCGATILLPTTLMGATLPALARHMAGEERQVGAKLGSLYAINTFGAVAGAAASGFYLLGRLGLAWSLALAAVVDILVGAAVLLLAREGSTRAAPASGRGPAAARGPALARGPAAARGTEPPVPAGKGTRAPPPAAEPADPEAARRFRWAAGVLVLAFGISGFANMCLQLGWTRGLILAIGNSTYAFSVILVIFIFGLAAGGWIAGLFADRLKNPLAAFGWLLVATAAAAGATLPWLGTAPARFAWEVAALSKMEKVDFVRFMWAGAGSVALVVLPATLLMGMAFPLAGRVGVLAGRGVGRAVGGVYAANTLGAILGTALTGFVLLSVLGKVWMLLYLAVGLSLIAGVAVLAAAPGKRRGLRWAALGAGVAGLLALAYPTRPHGLLDSPAEARPYWHPVLLSMGAYLSLDTAGMYASREEYVAGRLRQWEPLYYRDGEASSVAVLRRLADGQVCLKISGKTEASAGESSMDLQTQLLSGHLPLLAHPHPRHSLNLGLGGGMSLGSMVIHSTVESVDLLELSPEVEEAARLYFSHANQSALTDGKVRKVIGDGRNHLTHTEKVYDVITSEPSNFWIAGLGNLFTEDFYRIVLDRLSPGGVLCQWIYGYSIRMEDYRTALRTFLRVFPHALVWSTNDVDTLLLGSREPIVFDRERIARAMAEPKVRDELALIGISEPEDLFRYIQCRGSDLLGWLGDGPTNRDLFPVLEYSSPLGFYDADARICLAVAAATPQPLAPELFRPSSSGAADGGAFSTANLARIEERRSQGRLLNGFFIRLFASDFHGAVEQYKLLARESDVWGLDQAAHRLAIWLQMLAPGPERSALLQAARQAHDTPDLCMADGFRAGPSTDLRSQLAAYRRYAEGRSRKHWRTYLTLARLEGQASEGQKSLISDALKILEKARELGAPGYRVAASQGVLLGMMGDLAGAEKALREALETGPGAGDLEQAEAAYNLGYCLERRGVLKEAEAEYRRALEMGYPAEKAGMKIALCLQGRGEASAAALKAVEELVARAQAQAASRRGSEEADPAAKAGSGRRPDLAPGVVR